MTAWSAPGTSSTTEPSGRSTARPVAFAGIARSTGVPGWTASVGACEPPSSSPVRFARRTGNATWSGRSDLARLEGEDGRRQAGPRAGVEEGSAGGARDDRPGPLGERQLGGRGDVGRRQVDVAEDRLGRVERADARVREGAGDRTERARRGRSDGQDRRPWQGRGQRALEDDEVPARCRRRGRPWPDTRTGRMPNRRTFGR